MIICGFGSTHLIGRNVKITENFLNIVDAFHTTISNRCGKDVATELLFSCLKYFVLEDAEDDVRASAKEELLSALSRLADDEIVLSKGGD